MAHRSEKGSVIGFVLVGTALAAAFVGGVYMVRHSGELNSTDTQQTAQTSQSETTKKLKTSKAATLRQRQKKIQTRAILKLISLRKTRRKKTRLLIH